MIVIDTSSHATAGADLALARRYAPIVRFDDRESFLPSVAGYTIFHRSGASPSFLTGADTAQAKSARTNGPGTKAKAVLLLHDHEAGHRS